MKTLIIPLKIINQGPGKGDDSWLLILRLSRAIADPLVRTGCSVGFSSYLGRLATVCTNSFLRISPYCWFIFVAAHTVLWCFYPSIGLAFPISCSLLVLRGQSRSRSFEVKDSKFPSTCLLRSSHGIINLASNNISSIPRPSLATAPSTVVLVPNVDFVRNTFNLTPLPVFADFYSTIPLMTQRWTAHWPVCCF